MARAVLRHQAVHTRNPGLPKPDIRGELYMVHRPFDLASRAMRAEWELEVVWRLDWKSLSFPFLEFLDKMLLEAVGAVEAFPLFLTSPTNHWLV